MQTSYQNPAIAQRDAETRGRFIAKVYNHLAVAILGFIGIEVLIFSQGWAEPIARTLYSMPGGWLVVLGGFMLASWGASRLAHTTGNKAAQYAGLALLVTAEALLFVLPLYVASQMAPGIIEQAVWITAGGTAALTGIVFYTRKDFSFLRGILMWGFVLALILIVASVLFGLELGTWFSVGMIGFAGAAVLYDTSNVLHHYPEDQYVGASLQLFASIALMLWYVLQLLMSLAGQD